MRVTRTSFQPPPLKIPFSPTKASATWRNGWGGAAGGPVGKPQVGLSVTAPMSADLRATLKVNQATRTITVTVGGNALPNDDQASRHRLSLAAPMLNGDFKLVVKSEAGKVLFSKPIHAALPA